MRAVASFGDDPVKIEIILPPGDPQVMLADVATKPNFQLFGTALSYSYPDEEPAKRPAQPANTLIEIGVPYCFHVPINTMIMLKDAKATSHLVFKKLWTIRAEGSSDADYLSPTHVLYHNKTSIKNAQLPDSTQPPTRADLHRHQCRGAKGRGRPLSLQPGWDIFRYRVYAGDADSREWSLVGAV